MHVAICGGGLQGVELAWLAAKAGWKTTLLDARSFPPACLLTDEFIQTEFSALRGTAVFAEKLADVDLFLPAVEDPGALVDLAEFCGQRSVPFAHDAASYFVSSSKLESRALFLSMDTAVPRPCMEPVFPMIAKPSAGSGSEGVHLFQTREELFSVFPQGVLTPDWIFESFCPGPSYSIEVCGTPGKYETFQITALYMDELFDCKRVEAPSGLSPQVEEEFRREALRIAEALTLHGIMDVEGILTSDGMRILEIDARFPSQTPTAVWLSTGVNLAERLACSFLPPKFFQRGKVIAASGAYPSLPPVQRKKPCCALYEHVVCDGSLLMTQGERAMVRYGPLVAVPGFFGADEALVSYLSGRPGQKAGFAPEVLSEAWAATLMFAGNTLSEVRERRGECLHALQRSLGLRGHVDREPVS